MKIAFVHDWLVYPGGAEKVFFDLIDDILNKKWYFSFPEIKAITSYEIFTTFYNPNFVLPEFVNKNKIKSVLSTTKIWSFYRNFFPLFPVFQKKLSAKIRSYNPDLVIISSFAIWKNIDFSGRKYLYLHSPMQYIWSHYEDYLKKFSGVKKTIFKLSAKYLRTWDKKYNNFDYVIANSTYTKNLAKQIYNINVEKVIFPKVNIPNFKKVDVVKKYNLNKDYFLYVWRLVRLVKNVDYLIKIFNKYPNKQLVLVGDWPDRNYLQSLAWENIKFLGYIPNTSDDYWNLILNSKAVINLTKESFWIVNYQVGKLWKTLISIDAWAINDIPWNKFLIKKFEDLEKYIEEL